MELPKGLEPPGWLAETDPLRHYWDRPVAELVSAPVSSWRFENDPSAHERYRLHALLVLALLHHYRNGNKYGVEGRYRHRVKQRLGDRKGDLPPEQDAFYRPPDTYLGHNISCIAVDGTGEIIDFEFNHNEIYASSMEHAESRLVRRVFSLTKIYDDWFTTAGDQPEMFKYTDAMELVTIFTSLESCSQCAGIMALGGVRDVVYLQVDPGMSSIGNILYNLTRTPTGGIAPAKIASPYPLSARAFGFGYTTELEDGYETFRTDVSNESPFFAHATLKPSGSPSITSFLCTDVAQDIFERAYRELDEKLEKFRRIRDDFAKELNAIDTLADIRAQFGADLNSLDPNELWEPLADQLQRQDVLTYPNYRPPMYKRDGTEVPSAGGRVALSNAAVLRNVERFWEFARRGGHRGAPHKI